VSDPTLCWLALSLLFRGPSAAARRVLGRFPSVTEIFRGGRADFDGLRLDPAAVEAIVSGLAPGRLAVTCSVGKSTLGNSLTGSNR